MSLLRITVFCVWLGSLAMTSSSFADEPRTSEAGDGLTVMSWNIWHGGREDGDDVGPRRVVDVIRDSGADIVAMQETYGSGEFISEELGFHYQSRGTNLSIHSRYEIIEDISVHEAFNCVGSLIELPDGHRVAFYCVWLPYSNDIWLPDVRENLSDDEWQAACQVSQEELQKIADAIEQRLSDDRYRNVSLIVAGDFNSMSHLDYTAASQDQFGRAIDWQTSHVLLERGLRDAYRELRPDVDRSRDSTWSPRFPEQEQDRIDYVYYRSSELRANQTEVIREHGVKFPSDHAALTVTYRPMEQTERESSVSLRVASYNIRRGMGTDNRTDFTRTTEAIRELDADFVGLQEVDLGVARSGSLNQPAALSKELGMHVAFAPFLSLQGGAYGMAVLSKHPIRDVIAVDLPEGNEPRVALAVKVLLPNDRKLTIVNVHFDWVKDDRFRFAQAEALVEFLADLDEPYLLVGDFNDTTDSRTLALFRTLAIEIDKPDDQRLTWPADHPETEIDFVFTGPDEDWNHRSIEVIDEPVASDHRPVLATVELK